MMATTMTMSTGTPMLNDFLVRAALAAVGVAAAAAPLGCFVIWRRMAYFSDATAHAALLGVAIALTLQAPIFPTVLVVSLAAAVIVTQIAGREMASDTALGVIAHGALALGLVAVSLVDVRIDVDAFLFGDVLAVTRGDLGVIWLGAFAVVSLVVWRWSAWLLVVLSPDLARAQGLDPKREELILTLALAIVVAVAIQVVGALLIASLLIIPAAAARPWAKSPEWMATIAGGIGIASALGGLQVALWADTPAGPSIVVVAVFIFTISTLAATLRYGWGGSS